MRILIIEDDVLLARTLKRRLSNHYVVEVAHTGEDGEYQAYINSYDLVILDLGLPDMPGQKLCKKIRELNPTTPILILTADTEITDKVEAFNLGADDYLTKPFHFDELDARIKVLLRRGTPQRSASYLQVGELTLDLNSKQVYRQDQPISLRKKEFYLLEYLMRNAGIVVTRDMLLDHVWDSAYEAATNTVDVHIKYLRDRIDRNYEYKMIQTVHGIGYKLTCP